TARCRRPWRQWQCACRLPVSSFRCPVSGCRLPVASRRLLLDRLDLATAVVAAVLADDVRLLGFVALRALAAADLLEGVVGAALGGAGLRMPAFRIRHGVFSVLLLIQQALERGQPGIVPRRRTVARR